MSILMQELIIPPTFLFDTAISIVFLLVATRLGYRNKDVSTTVSIQALKLTAIARTPTCGLTLHAILAHS